MTGWLPKRGSRLQKPKSTALQTRSASQAKASAQWNLSAYANAPRMRGTPALAEHAPEPEKPPAPQITYATSDHRARQQQRLNMLARITHQ